MTNSPIAYTYEADVHCWGCSILRFGPDPSGTGYVREDAVDSEGNGIGVIAPWDETEYTHCGTCGEEL